MKVIILAGGFGTRISEESHLKPKPMIEIGEQPILWHIMKIYYSHGIKDFIIACGYKQQIIKEYFANYALHRSDLTFDFSKAGKIQIHNNISEDWKVTLVDTGLNTMTGGRIKQLKKYIGDETFMMTYGDGVSDIDITALANFHKNHGKKATLTAVMPGGRFGTMDMAKNGRVDSFAEKTKESGGWINGGFMVLDPSVFDLIENDSTVFEREPLEKMANRGELMAYKHPGFWQCMDAQKDKQVLEDFWKGGHAPWKIWN
jgi:glucose-1-phosphate cytidylyltransferase